MSVTIVYPTNPYHLHYWHGDYSKIGIRKAIETYVVSCLTTSEKPVSLIIALKDGIDNPHSYNDDLRQLKSDTIQIVGALCTRYVSFPRILYLPLDDEIFTKGLLSVLSSVPRPSWESRKSMAFWRGGASGGYPSVRTRTTDLLWNYPHADVKLINKDWNKNMPIPEEQFGDCCELDKHFQYKYIFIIDGNIIASNHQWVFGSGSVPIMITHPENNWWFKSHLKPMVNYVPIQYDLSDLKEKIHWLIANDDKAKTIMEGAMELASTLFSHEGQAQYLKEAIESLIQTSG